MKLLIDSPINQLYIEWVLTHIDWPMPREKVLDKQAAILQAAIAVFAKRGFWDTPTSLISKTAGIADGTLFNYFETKDDLVNEVYLELKKDLAKHMLEGLPSEAPFKELMRHRWNAYIEWGVNNPEKFKVLHQIGSSYKLDPKIKAITEKALEDVQRLTLESIARGEMKDYPPEYLGALIEAQAMMTIEMIAKNKNKMAYYQTIGFDILWNGVTR